MVSLSSFTSVLLVITKQLIVKATANFLLKSDFPYSKRHKIKLLGQPSCWMLAVCTGVGVYF